jgi:hypothetical protein
VLRGGGGYIAGDFNLWPTSAIHSAFTGGCSVDSGDQYRTYDAVEGLVAKIDHIWSCPGPSFAGTPLRQPYCNGRYSDHCYIFWRLTFA